MMSCPIRSVGSYGVSHADFPHRQPFFSRIRVNDFLMTRGGMLQLFLASLLVAVPHFRFAWGWTVFRSENIHGLLVAEFARLAGIWRKVSMRFSLMTCRSFWSVLGPGRLDSPPLSDVEPIF